MRASCFHVCVTRILLLTDLPSHSDGRSQLLVLDLRNQATFFKHVKRVVRQRKKERMTSRTTRASNGSGGGIFWFSIIVLAIVIAVLALASCRADRIGKGRGSVLAPVERAVASGSPVCDPPTVVVRSKLPDSTGWAAPLLYLMQSGPISLQDTVYHQRGGNTCLVTPVNSSVQLAISNVRITGRANPKFRWGGRCYGVTGSITCSVVEDVAEEHGFYFGLGAGDLLIADCLFQRIGSQAVQFRFTQSPPWLSPVWGSAGNVILRDCFALDCTQTYGKRPAFTYSMKAGGPNRSLLLERVRAVGTGPFGALEVEYWKSATVRDCEFSVAAGSKYLTAQFFEYSSAPGTLQAPAALELLNSSFGGGSVGLRLSEMQSVRIAGCQDGNVKLYHFTSGAWRLASQFPIEQGFLYVQ